MRLLIAVYLISLLGHPAFAASAAPRSPVWNPDGSFTLDTVPFMVCHFDPDWNRIEQSELQGKKGAPAEGGSAWELSGVLVTKGSKDPLNLIERVEPLGTRAYRLSYEATDTGGLLTSALVLDILLPVQSAAGKAVLLDDALVPLPVTYGEVRIAQGDVHALVIPSPSGTIRLEGNLHVIVQDNRRWGGNTFEIRVAFVGTAPITKSLLAVVVVFHPYESLPIPFPGQANMGFRDEVPDDRKGGWTDQGPDHDLASLPSGLLCASGVTFDILDPARNNGKGALVFGGPGRDYFPKAATIPVTGSPVLANLYLLHAIAWTPMGGVPVARIIARYTDGSETSGQVVSGRDVGDWWNPIPVSQAALGWSGRSGRSPVGLYVSRFPIERKPLREIRLETEGNAVWMVTAISGAADDIVLPLSSAAPARIVLGPGWAPFSYSLDIAAGSAFDFSALTEAPAGKNGPVVATGDGHLAFADHPDRPVRFWGVNLCLDANFPPHDVADRLAERLVRSGYNAVRLHHFDGGLLRPGGHSWDLDPQKLDRLDYLFAACKRRGLYVNIDLYVDRSFSRDEIPDLGHDFSVEIKGLLPFSEKALSSWQAYARALLTHVNPYTGLSWAGDPALSGICPVNEDTLPRSHDKDPALSVLYEKAYVAWRAALPSGEPGDRGRFLGEVQRDSDQRMADFLHSLGVRALLTGVNYKDWERLVFLREHYDYVDNHSYWDHPQFPEKEWSLPFGFTQLSATSDAAVVPRTIMASRLFGKPYTVTEFNYVWPNRYRSEGGLLMPAYASLQDWDALYNFDYAASVAGLVDATKGGLFNIASDPIGLLADRCGAVLFRRGDIQAAPHAIGFTVRSADAFSGEGNRDYPENFSMLGLVTRIGSLIEGGKQPPVTARIDSQESPGAYLSGPGLAQRLSAGGILPPEKEMIQSETGQLELSSQRGTFQVVTPTVEGFVLPPSASLHGDLVSVANGEEFGTVCLLSIDGVPLTKSNRLLLLHLTDSLNDGTEFADAERRVLRQGGSLPHLVRAGSVTVRLRLANRGPWQVWIIAPDGSRIRPVPFQVDGDALVLSLNTVTPDGVALAYEVIPVIHEEAP